MVNLEIHCYSSIEIAPKVEWWCFKSMQRLCLLEVEELLIGVVTVEKGGVEAISEHTERDQGAGASGETLSAALGEDSSEFVESLSHGLMQRGMEGRKINGQSNAIESSINRGFMY